MGRLAAGEPNRYIIVAQMPAGGVAPRLLGMNAPATHRISLISIGLLLTHGGIGTGRPVGLNRSSTVTGGTLITPTQIPKFRTGIPNSVAEIRVLPTAGNAINSTLMIMGGATVNGADLTSQVDRWLAYDKWSRITIEPTESLLWRGNGASSVQDSYAFNLEWEEVPV